MKILIIGSGAVGGFTAAMLAKQNTDVHLVNRHKEVAKSISETGIIIKGIVGKTTQIIPCFSCIEDTPCQYNLIIMAMKAYDLQDAAERAKAKLAPDGYVATFQNGMCEEKLFKLYGTHKVIGVVIGYGATLIKPGVIEVTSKGDIILGKFEEKDDPYLENIEYAFWNIMPSIIVDNIFEYKYSKLIINACITSMGAISGLKLGKMLIRKKFRNIFLSIIKEAIDVSTHMKIEIPDYAGKLNYYNLLKGKSLYHRTKRHLFILMFGLKYRRLKSSALQSLERNQKTEIPFINGYIVKKAMEFGIDVPINKKILTLTQRIENKEIESSPEHFEQFWN